MELFLLLKTALVLLSAPPPGQAFSPWPPPCTHISPCLLPCPSGELWKPSARTAAGVQGCKGVFCPSTTLLFHKHTHGCRLYGQDAPAPAGKLPAACSSWWEWPPEEGGAGGAVGLFPMLWHMRSCVLCMCWEVTPPFLGLTSGAPCPGHCRAVRVI